MTVHTIQLRSTLWDSASNRPCDICQHLALDALTACHWIYLCDEHLSLTPLFTAAVELGALGRVP